MSLTQEIYTQLLELYARDLEAVNTGLELQIHWHEINRGYNPPLTVDPIRTPHSPPSPNWPHQYPFWCITTTESRPE